MDSQLNLDGTKPSRANDLRESALQEFGALIRSGLNGDELLREVETGKVGQCIRRSRELAWQMHMFDLIWPADQADGDRYFAALLEMLRFPLPAHFTLADNEMSAALMISLCTRNGIAIKEGRNDFSFLVNQWLRAVPVESGERAIRRKVILRAEDDLGQDYAIKIASVMARYLSRHNKKD